MDGSLQAVEPWLSTGFGKTDFGSAFKPGFSFPTEFPYEFDSAGSSSPDESVAGSPEAESSEDDDFLAGLTRRLAEKKWVMSESPESTLSGLGSWSASSNGSPNGVLSPPTTPFGAKNDTWDLIHAAAGQVAKLKLNNEGNVNSNHHGRGSMTPLKLQKPAAELKHQRTQFFSGHNAATHMNQYECVARNEQMLKRGMSPAWEKQQVRVSWQAQPQLQGRNRAVTGSCENGGRLVRPVALPNSAWPSVQVPAKQPPPRAVFLSGSGVKKERAGTGVFLPRRYDNPTPAEPKKKPACSTAYLPPRVVQALNLNLDDLNSSYGAMMARGNAVVAMQQRRNLRHDNVLPNHEVRLPRDWTY